MGLVERVRDDVEQSRGKAAEPALEHHEAHLGNCRKRKRTLHARLREHHDTTQERGDRADYRQQAQRGGREHQQRAEPDHEKPSCIDNASVHQGGNRRGRLHRVGQPAVKRKLGRLGHRRQDKQASDGPDQHRVRCRLLPQGHCLVEQVGVVEAAKGGIRHRQGGDQKHVAEQTDEEFFPCGPEGPGPMAVVAEEFMEAEVCEEPGGSELKQVTGGDQQEHRAEREEHPAEELPLLAIAVEIADRVPADDRTDKADQQQHDRCEVVKVDAEVEGGQAGHNRQANVDWPSEGQPHRNDNSKCRSRHAQGFGQMPHEIDVRVRPVPRDEASGHQHECGSGDRPGKQAVHLWESIQNEPDTSATKIRYSRVENTTICRLCRKSSSATSGS